MIMDIQDSGMLHNGTLPATAVPNHGVLTGYLVNCSNWQIFFTILLLLMTYDQGMLLDSVRTANC
jgi:hypothetical protein